MITYRVGKNFTLDEFINVYQTSTLGERRPIEDRARMQSMMENANLIVTAWSQETLVGISRSLSDFVYATYLSDLAVDRNYQNRGIGKELIRRTQAEAPKAKVILLSAPKATEYYPRLGMQQHPSAWWIDGITEIK